MIEAETMKFLAENKDSILAIAAIGALVMTALTAVMSLFGAITAKKIDEKIKRQEAIRVLIEDGMIGMGESIQGILSAADILLTKYGIEVHQNDPSLNSSIKKYKTIIGNHKKHLMKAKTIYRYKLYGIEDGLSIITRCTDWIQGLKDDIPLARKMLKEADKIRLIVDKEIIKCYRKGDYPSSVTRWRLVYHSWKIKKMRQG
ncbi:MULTISPECIES: hypothetical protein [unclassified Colwellia]|uniref:hypothetical protein n=1 Tax=unclassified Colwellia TaxID=196834 RepID=UPI0015F6C722|nr:MULTISPECIES: hypothetical protein [unclassified Colwellia]MBA6256762.1 hypothetical protein [Colwellia sp. MB3u-28]MBA6261232.1 hypothetical protein [Colwellia sp. MB3u-41]